MGIRVLFHVIDVKNKGENPNLVIKCSSYSKFSIKLNCSDDDNGGGDSDYGDGDDV